MSSFIHSFMPISHQQLKELIRAPNADIEKVTSISSDGKNLLTRIPKEITTFLKIRKGAKVRWLVQVDSNELKLEIMKK